MDFFNATSAGAGFLKTSWGKNHMQAVVIARPVFRVEQGQLIPLPEVEWPVGNQAAETPYGEFAADVPFLTGGIDVYAIGSLWQPGGQPGTRLTAEVRVGDRFTRRITAIGERRWIRDGGGALAPGDPEPFISMPLTYDRDFGGKAQTEHGSAPWQPNPEGRGFYLTPEGAESKPLPNLEDPGRPIASIEDRPDPVATAPYPDSGSLRPMNAVDLDLESDNPGLKRVKPLLFNHANPRMIVPPADTPRSGETIEVTHATARGALRFAMPEFDLHVHVHLEHRNYFFPLHLDQIILLLDEERVVLGYRVAFKYRLVKGERRTVTLRQGPVPEGQIANTQI